MRTALVTGGTRGIGLAVARRLLADGFGVVLAYASDAAQAERALAELPGARAMQLDVRDSAAVSRLAEEPIDVLVHNGAIVRDHMLRFFPDADWLDLLDVDLTGGFRLARACLPGMQARGWGRVIQMGSYVGSAGAAGRSGYAAAKAGLLGLTRALAREVGPGVTVNAVCPGLVWTERTRAYPEAALGRAIAEIPLGRAGEPEEVASLVAFLASEDAGYVTGQALAIDGGLDMREFVS